MFKYKVYVSHITFCYNNVTQEAMAAAALVMVAAVVGVMVAADKATEMVVEDMVVEDTAVAVDMKAITTAMETSGVVSLYFEFCWNVWIFWETYLIELSDSQETLVAVVGAAATMTLETTTASSLVLAPWRETLEEVAGIAAHMVVSFVPN